MITKRMLAGAVCWAALALAGPAAAETYPQRTITLVTGYSAGGPSDDAARAIVDRMAAELGQPIVIENVAGAGGMVGAARVAKAAPDGYTLLIHQNGLAIGSLLFPQMNIDPRRDFAAVGTVNTSFSFLAVSKKVQADTLEALVAWAKEPGRSLRFAHPGIGTLAHLQALMFVKAFGIQAELVPYRGGAQAMNDVIAGHVDMVWAAPATAAELIKGGQIKSVAFGARRRYEALATVPSIAELGHPELALDFWHVLLAPAKTPPEILQRLNAALRKTLEDPQVLKAYATLGLEAFPPEQRSGEAAAKLVADEVQRWEPIIKENGIKAQ
jgi:tripartite-type tricarboxylate transporter receptor subunit TctC